jgi:hypothetical protein
MKYIKLYEDIDWDWVDEDSEPVADKFNKVEENILKNNFPIIIRIHKKYKNDLLELTKKYNISNKTNWFIIDDRFEDNNILYVYIRKRELGYMYDSDYTIDYNNRKYSHIEIIEIV